MFILIRGTKEAFINTDDFFIHCDRCEAYTTTTVHVYSLYHHIYWIPVCPVDKVAYTECSKCGLKRDDLYFDKYLVSNYDEIKGKFRHPIYTYSVLIFLGLLVFGVIAEQY